MPNKKIIEGNKKAPKGFLKKLAKDMEGGAYVDVPPALLKSCLKAVKKELRLRDKKRAEGKRKRGIVLIKKN